MNRALFFITILLFGITIMNKSVLAAGQYKKPLYVLELSISGAGSEIRLNDVPVIYHAAQRYVKEQKPIPEYIIDGENILSIRSFPLEEDGNKYRKDSFIDVTLSVREEDAQLKENVPLLHLRLNPNNDKNTVFEGTSKEIGVKNAKLMRYTPNEIIIQRIIDISSPFPRWAWQDGLTIEKTAYNTNSLIKKYHEIYSALKNNNMQAIFNIYDTAAQEFSSAYHLANKAEGHQLMSTGELVGDDEWVLADCEDIIERLNYGMEIYAKGKLARIVDAERDSPIVYIEKESQVLSVQKFGFFKNKNGEWVMVR